MYIHNMKGGKNNTFCEGCARYKGIYNDRIGNSTFIADSGKGHQSVPKPKYVNDLWETGYSICWQNNPAQIAEKKMCIYSGQNWQSSVILVK